MNEEESNTVEGFSVLEEIGKGSHAMLYRVMHNDEDAVLAVFHKRFAKSAQFVQGLEKLQGLYQQMEHPAMLKVYRWHYDKKTAWVLMEACNTKIEMEEPRKKKESFALIEELSQAIDEAHRKQFYHGGLSDSVLFQRADGSLCIGGWGRYFFASFPLKKIYLAPEDQVGSRVSDLYGVGLLSYQLLTGKLPWEEKCSKAEIEERKRKQELRPLTAFGFTEELTGVMNRALSNYPVNRFDSAGYIFESMVRPPKSSKNNIQKEKPPTIDVEKKKISWRKDIRIFLPLVVVFLAFAISVYFFAKEPPQKEGQKINMRFKAKSQKTEGKIEKVNRVKVEGVFFDFVEIPSGTQVLGARKRDSMAKSSEKIFSMEVSRSFLITQTEISLAQWNEVMDVEEVGGAYPKSDISWFDAVLFCNRLSKKMGKPEVYEIEGESVYWKKGARGYRLPTDAEWEYAARGKKDFIFAGSDDAEAVSWNVTNSKGTVQQIASKKTNAFFLYDMSGNVSEWVWDWEPCSAQDKCDYEPPKVVTPSYRGIDEGTHKIIRGGSALEGRMKSRASARGGMMPTKSSPSIGFRIVY